MTIAIAIVYALAGAGLGAAFFAALAANARLYATERPGAAVALHVARLAAIAVAFGLIATRGALPLLSAAAGFTLVRIAVLRRASRTAA